MGQGRTYETEPVPTPITISVVNGRYHVSREGFVELEFGSFDDLTDFLAEVLPEVNSAPRQRIIVEVLGGVAEVTSNPTGAPVEIVDHDNEGSA